MCSVTPSTTLRDVLGQPGLVARLCYFAEIQHASRGSFPWLRRRPGGDPEMFLVPDLDAAKVALQQLPPEQVRLEKVLALCADEAGRAFYLGEHPAKLDQLSVPLLSSQAVLLETGGFAWREGLLGEPLPADDYPAEIDEALARAAA